MITNLLLRFENLLLLSQIILWRYENNAEFPVLVFSITELPDFNESATINIILKASGIIHKDFSSILDLIVNLVIYL